jgi:hypothetical protein
VTEGKAEDVLEGLSTKVEFFLVICHDPVARERTEVPVKKRKEETVKRAALW